jgi:hypothetical protein
MAVTARVELRTKPASVLRDLAALRSVPLAVILGLLLAATVGAFGLLLAPVILGLELLVLRRTVSALTFGADGVALESYAGWRGFIRHAQLSHFDVQPDDKGFWFLRLHRVDGAVTLLAYSKRRDVVRGWHRAIEAAIAEARRPAARARVRELARRADDPEAWLTRLKEVQLDRGSYRANTLSEADLRLALEDPTCPVDERWAAAWILARANPQAKLRIAEVAREVARPELRKALDELALEESMEDEQVAAWMDRVRPPR